jgi:hypothetical protein
VGVEVELHPFLTSTLNRGKHLASFPGCFTIGEESAVLIEYEGGWAPEPIWMLWKKEENC